MISIVLSCLVLGAFIGFMAGLLGIGGGLIAVPVLLYLLPTVGVYPEHLTHVAIATSLGAIILTSLSSARAHHKRGNVPWPLLKVMLPGLILGALSAGFVSALFSADLLKQTFAMFVILMAIQMVFPFKTAAVERDLPKASFLFLAAMLIAIIAALMGIGGGVLLVPFLCWCGIQMRLAIGFSSVTGACIALFGSVSYVAAGWSAQGLPDYTLGYIYLPALVGIVCCSMLTAPLGAKAASIWPTARLKKIFALLLIVTGLKLVFT
ncbi:sulfite exporter TauE/SafE family protein [Shewanella sp. Isolate11]|uniref:sulfite exporter TauE/SafE family protein n=1 Tax=Shewanella sp. Isolate11 TaxID=2908530 RepID=UPI001EFC38BD|nr:sulfite exporter TauE/SafE family protein [Shewanella sp. Isolate11]MCG9695931.1 sulfite exporter TauE/SafE family protein [Shewanella sp. Isolate11]